MEKLQYGELLRLEGGGTCSTATMREFLDWRILTIVTAVAVHAHLGCICSNRLSNLLDARSRCSCCKFCRTDKTCAVEQRDDVNSHPGGEICGQR
jgi:hypothetical protein